MRITRATLAVVVATFGAAAPASSQPRGSVELGAFGQYTVFDNVLRLDNAPGAGVSAGLFIVRNLALESSLSLSPTRGSLSREITYRPWQLRLGYHIPLTRQLAIPVGLGYTKGIYDGDFAPNEHEDGVGAVVGVEYHLKPSWALNVEALFDRLTSPANQETSDTKGSWNSSIRAGVSWIYPPREQCTLAIDPPTASITQGDSRTFTATARGERTGKTCSGTVTFAATDSAISPRGIYTPSTPGTSTITALYRGRGQRRTASAKVTVSRAASSPAPVSLPAGPCIDAITIQPDTATVLRGETVQFSTHPRTCAGRDTTVLVAYSGGNVDQSGRFTAGTDIGMVQVTATATIDREVVGTARIRVVRLRSIVVDFDSNSAILDGIARARLDQLIADLRANPRVTVRVEGRADTTPPAATPSPSAWRRLNRELALARADSVTAYLLDQGLDRSRFEPRVRGFSFCAPAVPDGKPPDDQNDAQARPLEGMANRRVEIFELALNEDEQVRWVCAGRPEPVIKATRRP